MSGKKAVSVAHLTLSDAQVRELIQLVQKKPILYRESSSAYKDTVQKNEAWDQVAKQMKFTISGKLYWYSALFQAILTVSLINSV